MVRIVGLAFCACLLLHYEGMLASYTKVAGEAHIRTVSCATHMGEIGSAGLPALVGGYELLGAGEIGGSKATTCGIAVCSMLSRDVDGEGTMHCILFVLDC
jgi:hypothetical protein